MIGSYLVDSIVLKKYNGKDKWQTPIARTPETVKCYIEYKNVQVNDFAGNLVVSKAQILIRPRTIIRSGFETRAAKTIAYEDLVNFDSSDHTIVQIGKGKDFSTRFLRVFVQ